MRQTESLRSLKGSPMADRRTTTEMVQDLKRLIDAHIEAKLWLERATEREKGTRYEMSVAITELEQRALQAPKPE